MFLLAAQRNGGLLAIRLVVSTYSDLSNESRDLGRILCTFDSQIRGKVWPQYGGS